MTEDRKTVMRSIGAGDVVTRMLAGVAPMRLKVTSVTEDRIHCGPWQFDRDTGAEIDEDLGWTVDYTGSFLSVDDVEKRGQT